MSLRICSLEARGLWIEMLAIMGISERYGHLQVGGKAITMEQLGVMAGCSADKATALVKELEDAGAFSRDENGVPYSRRMLRDMEESELGRKYGRNGGNPALRKEKQEAKKLDANILDTPISGGDYPSSTDPEWTLDYVIKIASDINIPKKDAESWFQHYSPVDFVDGAGRQIVNLKFALQKWHNRQAQEQPKAKQLTPKVRAFLAEKEYDNALADCVDSLLHTDDMSRCLKVLWDKYKNTPVKEGKHVVNRAKEIADFRMEVASKQE